MSENYEMKVELKDELKKVLILGVDARLPIGIILGFAGYRHQVMPLVQTLSHSTRACSVNANGWPAFVLIDIVKILQHANENGGLET